MIVTCLSSVAAVAAASASGGPPLLAHATDLGPVNAATPVEVTLWLKLHDEAGLDDTLAAQQAGKAPYLSHEQVMARHAPSGADAARVSAYLKGQGLAVTRISQDNLYVRASGTAARIETAFRVELHHYNLRGMTFRASSKSATLPPELAPLVRAVGGLSDLAPQPQIARAKGRSGVSQIARASDAEGMKPRALPLGAGQHGLVFSAQCFYPATSESFSGGGVTASYQGNRYGADINSPPPNAAPCGYQPSEIHTAYNLTSLYNAHLDGAGTTIAIVDAFGSTTIQYDAQAFAYYMGLPPVNLTVVGTPTESNFSGDPNSGWATETTLDVEWVHSIAPGANILLVVAPTNSFDDLFNAIITAASTPGVVAISNSWDGLESQTDPLFRAAVDGILKAIDAQGEAVNFSSGDSGNETVNLGFQDVDWPSSSPYVTSVGGVSVALDANNHIAWQTSWGTNITEIADTIALGSPPVDPPFNEGFIYGGGGGTSNVYSKPSWQRALGGQRRLVPDISWVADPYTGVEIIYSTDAQNDLGIEAIGGTSVSCPMFTALWGIATQHAHHRLGQAAPRLYHLPAGAITDVPANPGSQGNVTGTITDANGTARYSTWDLALPLQGLPSFISALYNSPHSTRWFVLGFGLDSSLQTGPGWDPATGLGTPDGWNFVQSFGGDD
jgi:subtilase family serine protease